MKTYVELFEDYLSWSDPREEKSASFEHVETGKIVGPYNVGTPEYDWYNSKPKLWLKRKRSTPV